MNVKAIQSFIGKISMNIDDEKEIIDKKLAEDLIKAGYVVEIKKDELSTEEVEATEKVEEKATKKNKNKK